MAITKNPTAADTPAPHTVLRAFFWPPEVRAVDSVVHLTKAEAAPLLAANKVVPGEPAAEAPKTPKKPKAPEETTP